MLGLAGCQSWQGRSPDAATFEIPKDVTLQYVDGNRIARVRGSDRTTVKLDPGRHSLGFLVTNELGQLGGMFLLEHTSACFVELEVVPNMGNRIAFEYLADEFPDGTYDASPKFSAWVEQIDPPARVGRTYCVHPPESTKWRSCELTPGFPHPIKPYMPDYPSRAMMSGRSGELTIAAVVGRDGGVARKPAPRIIESSDYELFGKSEFSGMPFMTGLDLIQNWSFEPDEIADHIGERFTVRCDYRHPASKDRSNAPAGTGR
jgi:hypothetical protein